MVRAPHRPSEQAATMSHGDAYDADLKEHLPNRSYEYAGARRNGAGAIVSKLFQRGSGDWTQYRSEFGLSKCDEIDLHFGRRDRSISFGEAMAQVTGIIEGALNEAQQRGRPYVMLIHGSSTSRRGKTTARSQVRGFMRSKAATSLVERKHCLQHETVFVAKVRAISGPTLRILDGSKRDKLTD
jgi:hypothetical protein